MITKKFEKLTAYCAVHRGRFDGNDNCPFCAEVRMITTEPKASPVSMEYPLHHEWPVGDQVAKLQARVAVLEDLLRASLAFIDGPLELRLAFVPKIRAILAPAPLTEGE